MKPLPLLMVAPNGARLSHDDHPGVPLSLPEITEAARSCFKAGAKGLHLHLRDSEARHVLDAGLYREALAELKHAVPEMALQITTESVGRYAPDFQRRLALDVGAEMVSAALREISADGDMAAAYGMHQACHERGIALQYILYEPAELAMLANMLGATAISDNGLQLLFVLGRHGGHDGAPEMLDGFLDALKAMRITPDWMVCAFGVPETDCLLAAHARGGKLRVGFENSLFNRDGSLARNNMERVTEIRRLLKQEAS